MQASNYGMVFKGIEEAKQGNTLLGLRIFSESAADPRLPQAKAWHGYCLAREKNAFRHAIALCHEARQLQPENAEIYLALGRIYLLAGRRITAVKTLQQGLKLGNNRDIDRLLASIGVRKPPVFRLLDRDSRINIVLGRLFSSIGLR